MQRRDLSKLLAASAAGSVLLPKAASATCTLPCYPQSAAELAASVVPTNTAYPPGSVLRYGADPTGATDSSTAWSNAIKANSHVFDDYPGGGSYLFNSEVVISRYPVTIEGSAKNIGSGTGGTQITLQSVAGFGAACLRTTAWASSIRIEKIRFAWQSLTTNQIGLRFAELRSSRVIDCCFLGSQATGTNVIGIQFDGTGTFTGDVAVRNNYFSALLYGVNLLGSCTSVRIVENEMYGYVSGATSIAITYPNTSAGLVAAFNYIEGWTTGIYSAGAYVKQIGNSYEVNSTNFQWVRGAGNARIWNLSVGEAFISGGTPVYPVNDNDLCMVIGGPGTFDVDVTTVNADRGFNEYRRTAKLGDWIQIPYSSGNYYANGGATWSVTAAQQVTLQYSFVGHTVKVNFVITGSSLTAGATQLVIAMPAGTYPASQLVATTCCVNDGTAQVGYVQAVTGGTVGIEIGKINGAAFAAGAFSCYGSIEWNIG